MLEVFYSLLGGFSRALSLVYLYYALLGVILGTITGVLPGIGPVGAMAILLSLTYTIDPTGAMILFAGVYYGAMYGGSTTSILLNIPGEAASVVTCLDGYKMCQKGRAGAALTLCAVGSFIAGTIGIFGLSIATLFLADVALKFGPPEFFAIGVTGLLLLVRLSSGPMLQGFIMILFGMAFATVGIDVIAGVERFTFGVRELAPGIGLIPVAMGFFGIAEVLSISGQKGPEQRPKLVRMMELLPTRTEWRRAYPAIFRGSFIGFMIGLIPGPSPIISSFVSYATEKRISKHPEEFGKGAVEGLAGPESANNAAVAGAYVPLFALGLPFTPAMAIVLGALMLHGLTPGPNLIREHSDLFWTVIASMYVGNFILLVLNLPLVNLFVRILRIPRQILVPTIVMICLIGIYNINESFLDMLMLSVFGIVGFASVGIGFQPAPLVLAMVIGPMIETSLRQSLIIHGGDVTALIFKPICLTLYILVALTYVVPLVLKLIRKFRVPSPPSIEHQDREGRR